MQEDCKSTEMTRKAVRNILILRPITRRCDGYDLSNPKQLFSVEYGLPHEAALLRPEEQPGPHSQRLQGTRAHRITSPDFRHYNFPAISRSSIGESTACPNNILNLRIETELVTAGGRLDDIYIWFMDQIYINKAERLGFYEDTQNIFGTLRSSSIVSSFPGVNSKYKSAIGSSNW